MEVIITKKARNDLYDFFVISRADTENYVINYINELIDCTDFISKSANIGKVVDYIKQYTVRRLLHKKHKILYIIFNNKFISYVLYILREILIYKITLIL